MDNIKSNFRSGGHSLSLSNMNTVVEIGSKSASSNSAVIRTVSVSSKMLSSRMSNRYVIEDRLCDRGRKLTWAIKSSPADKKKTKKKNSYVWSTFTQG